MGATQWVERQEGHASYWYVHAKRNRMWAGPMVGEEAGEAGVQMGIALVGRGLTTCHYRPWQLFAVVCKPSCNSRAAARTDNLLHPAGAQG